VTKDGVTVAKEVELADKMATWAADGQGMASKTSDVAGDGTTTATVRPRPSSTRALAWWPPARTRWTSNAGSMPLWPRWSRVSRSSSKPTKARNSPSHASPIGADGPLGEFALALGGLGLLLETLDNLATAASIRV